MRNIIIILTLVLSTSTYSQVIIGDEVGTATDKTSVLLEFSKTEKKGIILPYTTALPNNPSEGTILLDASTPTSAKIKYYNGEWIDLSNDEADISSVLSNQPQNISESNVGVIIGSETTSADGVLVLESTDKAMVLPTVPSIEDVVNPSPGMMVYLSNNKMLALFNGANWSFWTANE